MGSITRNIPINIPITHNAKEMYFYAFSLCRHKKLNSVGESGAIRASGAKRAVTILPVFKSRAMSLKLHSFELLRQNAIIDGVDLFVGFIKFKKKNVAQN